MDRVIKSPTVIGAELPVREFRVTRRMARIIDALSKGKTVATIAIELGLSRQSIYDTIDRLKDRLPDLMDEAGMSDVALVQKYLLPALNATETKFFQKDGVVTDSREVVAWGPRLTSLDMAFKLKGRYPKTTDTNITNQIVVNQGIAALKHG